eukprot:2250689-Alexandrium_andersonii.AAC.1
MFAALQRSNEQLYLCANVLQHFCARTSSRQRQRRIALVRALGPPAAVSYTHLTLPTICSV